MFGYVLPLREELKVRDWERFRQTYCGLCRTMGRRCGQLSRLLLSYDFTFLALLLGADGAVQRCRCPAAPCRGRRCQAQNAALELAADESMILSWWKLQDQIQDEKGLKRLAAKFLSLVFRRAYRRAAARQIQFDRVVSEQLAALRALEDTNCASLDQSAETFARILTAAVPQNGTVLHDRAMEQLLYHLGRWIYLIDAWDDAAEDLKSGSYNPIVLRYGLKEAPAADSEAGKSIARTLLHSTNLALSALRLLPEEVNTPILENILWGGLPTVQRAVLTGAWKRRKKFSVRDEL